VAEGGKNRVRSAPHNPSRNPAAPEAAPNRVQVVLKRKKKAAPEAAPNPVLEAPMKNPPDRVVEAGRNSAVRTIRLKNGVSGRVFTARRLFIFMADSFNDRLWPCTLLIRFFQTPEGI
jgi:hypothetical protein